MINYKKTLFFSAVVFLIIFLELDLLKPVISVGLTPEDREFILFYKTLGINPLFKIFEVWSQRGAYTTIPIYYIGIIESLTGFNYQFIQYTGIFFRTLATLSIFVVILIVFNNRWLAVLTTVLFAISYTTTGALETGVEPSEYLGLLMMNIFLIVYFYLNTKYLLKLRWLFFSSLLLFLAVIISVMRVYPILGLLPIIEIFLWVYNSNKYKFHFLIIKLAVLYLPFIILNYFFPVSASGHFSLPAILSQISLGNWHLILTPLQGLGFIIPVSNYYSLLGVLDLSSFKNYLQFLLEGPLVVFGGATLVLSLISSKKPLYFFLWIFSINFGLEVLFYWISQHNIFVSDELRLNFEPFRLYSTFFGLFIVILAVNYFFTWYNQGKKKNLLLILWLGPSIALFFITLTYFFANINLSFGGAQDHYLLIPTFGVSLFLAGCLLLLKNKLSGSRLKSATSIFLIVFVMFVLYGLNKELIFNYFKNANANGRSAVGQQEMQIKIKQKLEDLDYLNSILVYFDTSDIPNEMRSFYLESLLTPFPFFMHLQGEKVVNGCIGVMHEDANRFKLKESIKKNNKQSVIIYPAICVDNQGMVVKDTLFKLDNLYAFKIEDNDIIDIKNNILNELELK